MPSVINKICDKKKLYIVRYDNLEYYFLYTTTLSEAVDIDRKTLNRQFLRTDDEKYNNKKNENKFSKMGDMLDIWSEFVDKDDVRFSKIYDGEPIKIDYSKRGNPNRHLKKDWESCYNNGDKEYNIKSELQEQLQAIPLYLRRQILTQLKKELVECY